MVNRFLSGFVFVFLFVAVGIPARSQELSAVPQGKCEIFPNSELNWSQQEEWTWEKICEGSIADLTFGPRGELREAYELAPSQERVLSARFLKTILLREPFRSAIPELGVHIIGARFEEELDLSSARIDAQLTFKGSYFQERVSFAESEFNRKVAFTASSFEEILDLNGIHAHESLYLNGWMGRQSQFAAVNLLRAEIDGSIFIVGASFSATLGMASIKIKGGLMMESREGLPTEFHVVDISSAEIGGTVSMIGSTFTKMLNMNNMRAHGNLYMHSLDQRPTRFADVSLVGAEIDGQAAFLGSKFTGLLYMTGIQVGGPVLMRGAYFERHVSLSGAILHNTLQLSLGAEEVNWSEGVTLGLLGAQIPLIEISEISLPKASQEYPYPLLLDGLQYQRLVVTEGQNGGNVLNANWYLKNWLERSEFSTQVYRQLADALVRDDRPDTALEILYASKEQQRMRAESWSWINLTVQRYLIGYGYRVHLALFWFAGFVLLGSLVHRTSVSANERSYAESLFFSFELLIPVLRLDQAHYEITFEDWRRYYFGAHVLVGFILVSFILAGISGLTK
jgi:hypothetical protein